jgi:hypothetical protein
MMEVHRHMTEGKIFRYRLDFYYQQAILYLVTLIVYLGVRGTVSWDRLPTLFADPVLYIIIVFALVSIVVLLLNKLRDRKLTITEDTLVFHNRYHDRVIPFANIEWMYIGRERLVQTAGRFQVIVFKIKDRRRLFRIRAGRYDHDEELLQEMHRLATRVPKISRPSLRTRMSRLAKQR